MHNRNITVLQEEAQRLIALEREILEQMLNQTGVLGNEDKGQRGTFTPDQTRLDLETLEGEHRKLQQLELVVAVVGTMKAGKSTTINAIVGTEVLPNRNRPMTAIPTLIRHTPGQVEPVLEFRNNAPIERLIGQLRAAADLSSNHRRVQDLESDKDMALLLREIHSGEAFQTRYEGADEIFTFLRTLNDLVRLSAILEIEFPFADYDEIDEIPSIHVEFAHLRGTANAQGSLTLLDTPGPNEAGQPHLRKMLSEQLAKASAVLAVLDFTQLKSEADAMIQAELKDIAEVAGGRVYAVVNKFDQADRNSDSAEDIKRFVSDVLTQGRIGPADIYPVSSRQAYLANRARSALALHQALPAVAQHAWVEDFGKEALGRSWTRCIDDNEQVLDAANHLWNDSLFEAPVDNVIRFAQRRSAILALDSAASKLLDTANRLANFFNTRETALGKSSAELQRQINALRDDIERVEASETAARRDAQATLKDLKKRSDTMLKEVKRKVNDEIEKIFMERKEEEAAQASAMAKGMQGGSLFSLFANLASSLSGNRDHQRSDSPYFDPHNPEMTFSSRSEAEAKLRAVQHALNGIIQSGEAGMKSAMSDELDGFQQKFSDNVLARARLIIDEMRSRLKDDGFELRLTIPKATILSLPSSGAQLLGELISEKTETRSQQRRQSGAWGTVCRWFNTDDWGWESYSVDVEVYTLDSRVIKKAVDKDIDAVFAGLNDALAEKIRAPIERGIDEFFLQFKEMVEQIRGDLQQGLVDVNRSRDEQEELLRRLAQLKTNVPAIRSDSEGLKRDVGESMASGGGAAA